jgi:hypothetical protein
MKAIADFIIAFFDLVEAEGRTLRRAIMRVGSGLLLLLIAAFLALASAAFFLVGMYQYFSSQFTSPVAALLLSGLALLLAFIIAALARWRTR